MSNLSDSRADEVYVSFYRSQYTIYRTTTNIEYDKYTNMSGDKIQIIIILFIETMDC